MMYPFMTLDDDTEIVHSEMHNDGSVVVCCEKPISSDFKTAYCNIPRYGWYDVENYSSEELDDLTRVLKSVSHLILKRKKVGKESRSTVEFSTADIDVKGVFPKLYRHDTCAKTPYVIYFTLSREIC